MLLKGSTLDHEKLQKEIEVYRLEKFSTLTIEQVNEVLDEITKLALDDIHKIKSRMWNGN